MTEQYQCKYKELCVRYAITREECTNSDSQYCHLRKNFEKMLAIRERDASYTELEKSVGVFR